MRYFKEYPVAVHNDETRQAEAAGVEYKGAGNWARCFIDFGCVVSFYEYTEGKNEILCEYNTGKCLHLNVPFEQFKRDFEEYLKQANKPFWSMQ